MAKLELKPWKPYEKQVVYINEDGTERLIVEFRPDQKYYQRLAHVEVLLENKKGERFWGNYDDWDNPAFSETWENEFLNLLGIPETIVEETVVNESQPHTIQGRRGQQMVTLKDIQIAECFLRGMLDAATYYSKDNDYSPAEKLNYGDLIHIIYTVRWMENFDPVAIVQSARCHVEKVLGIYPNIGQFGEITHRETKENESKN